MDLPNLSHPQGNKGGLHDDMLMNGGDIKMENPPTPHQHSECPPDIPSLGDMGHDFPPDCKLTSMKPDLLPCVSSVISLHCNANGTCYAEKFKHALHEFMN